MSSRMLRRLVCVLLPLAWLAPACVDAATAKVRIARVTTSVATLEQVEVGLAWPRGAERGQLSLRAARVYAPATGYRFRDVQWSCRLQRLRERGWHCTGPLRAGRSVGSTLTVQLDAARTEAVLSQGAAQLSVRRTATAPGLTRIDLARVPLAWTQALLAQAWPEARITGGTLDASLSVAAPAKTGLRVAGPLTLHAASLDTRDGTIAAENLGARLAIDVRFDTTDRVDLGGQLHGGELLMGNTYVALEQRTVDLQVQAERGDAGGWYLPRWSWGDGRVLQASGRLAFDKDANLQSLEATFRTGRLDAVSPAYLSGWLGAAGLGELELSGQADGHVALHDGSVRHARLTLDASIRDPRGRFGFDGLTGDVRFSGGSDVHSELRWRGGELYGLAFGPARLPLSSGAGAVATSDALAFPILGGQARFDGLRLKPPADGQGMELDFGLALDGLDVARLAEAMEWPAFTGHLSGRIPKARYRNNRLEFDGGLEMRLFDGRVAVSSLQMERPFGVAPTLSADVAIDDLDLEALTGVLGFGTITGRLDGRIDALRLVDWQPVAFDARLYSDAGAARRNRARQRISQRAVQDLSSVGDASLMTNLQSQLIGVFDDFGYSRIAIACRLTDEVCTMDGLGSVGRGFSIVQGSGVPRLQVVGFNRRVDWPTLVERLAAVGKGDVKPVVD